MRCLHIYFSGRVQGVGFRYTSRYLAKKYNLCGWVRNLPDGRVELFIQGEEKVIEDYLKDLNEEFKGYILDTQIESAKIDESLKDFHIKF